MPSGNFFQADANSFLDGLENQLIRFWGSKVTVASHDVNTLRDFWGNTPYHHINNPSLCLFVTVKKGSWTKELIVIITNRLIFTGEISSTKDFKGLVLVELSVS